MSFLNLRLIFKSHPSDPTWDEVHVWDGDRYLGHSLMPRAATWLEKRRSAERIHEMVEQNRKGAR